MIVDLTIGHEMLSLMDGFFGYNQIRIADEDQHQTVFTTPWGTFCYRVMPFGLKNAGATYQCAMTTIFHDLLHKIMEDYVDNLLGKSKTRQEHIPILKQIFERLEKYKLRLNPKKCVWRHIGKTTRIHCFPQRDRGQSCKGNNYYGNASTKDSQTTT